MPSAYAPVFFDIETTGFNPIQQAYFSNDDLDAQVIAIGIGTVKGWRSASSWEDTDIDVDTIALRDEYKLLERAKGKATMICQKYMEQGMEPFMVTFNGRKFDHPWLGARYARYRKEAEVFNYKYRRLDMFRALGKRWNEVSRYPKQDDLVERLGIPQASTLEGSDMPQAFKDNNWKDIKDHCQEDVEEMAKLFVETSDMCMAEFYDHYDIDRDANFTEEISFD